MAGLLDLFRRRSRPAQSPASSGDSPQPTPAWTQLAPLTPVVTGALAQPASARTAAFVRDLPTRWHQPPALEPLGHDVRHDAASGVLGGLLTPVPGGIGTAGAAPDAPLRWLTPPPPVRAARPESSAKPTQLPARRVPAAAGPSTAEPQQSSQSAPLVPIEASDVAPPSVGDEPTIDQPRPAAVPELSPELRHVAVADVAQRAPLVSSRPLVDARASLPVDAAARANASTGPESVIRSTHDAVVPAAPLLRDVALAYEAPAPRETTAAAPSEAEPQPSLSAAGIDDVATSSRPIGTPTTADDAPTAQMATAITEPSSVTVPVSPPSAPDALTMPPLRQARRGVRRAASDLPNHVAQPAAKASIESPGSPTASNAVAEPAAAAVVPTSQPDAVHDDEPDSVVTPMADEQPQAQSHKPVIAPPSEPLTTSEATAQAPLVYARPLISRRTPLGRHQPANAPGTAEIATPAARADRHAPLPPSRRPVSIESARQSMATITPDRASSTAPRQGSVTRSPVPPLQGASAQAQHADRGRPSAATLSHVAGAAVAALGAPPVVSHAIEGLGTAAANLFGGHDTATPPHAVTRHAPTPAATDDPAALDRLAGQLYGRLRSHLASDLLVGRERASLLTDL